MKIGNLVKHIEYECTGIVIKQGVSTCDKWLVHFGDGWTYSSFWCTECELEVISASR